jgi:hypothetical protein
MQWLSAMPLNITFRTQLLGSVTEFCTACSLPLFSNALHLVELIVLLAKYKEEGISLYPEVYTTTDMDAIVAMLPDSERVNLGETTKDVKGIVRAVKKTAPLATGGWLVYIEDRNDRLTFGLFRGSGNPVSVLVDRVLLDKSNTVPVKKIFQVAEDCVEIVCSAGEHHFVFLNHRKDDSPPPLESFGNLIAAITSKSIQEFIDPTGSYLTRIIYNALRVSHGTLIAVTDKAAPPRRLFNDGLALSRPIDFPELIRDVKRETEQPERLNIAASLLTGMLNSDGIILFDNKARLLGFNYFVRAKQNSTESGGARRRAFATLAGNLGKGLCGAFIQSQDGWSEFRGTQA